MLDTWQELPSDRPTFIDLRSKFDSLLSRQRNAGELYIDLNLNTSGMAAELGVCKGKSELLEVERKLSQNSNPFESIQEEMVMETSNDSGMDSTRHVTNPYVDYPTHTAENPTRPIHLVLPREQSSTSILRPLTSPAHLPHEGHSPGNISLPLPMHLSTSAPNRFPPDSWNVATMLEHAQVT